MKRNGKNIWKMFGGKSRGQKGVRTTKRSSIGTGKPLLLGEVPGESYMARVLGNPLSIEDTMTADAREVFRYVRAVQLEMNGVE